MNNEQPKEVRFNYQKEENPGLSCKKCGRSSELLYGIHDPVPHDPGRMLKVCAMCLSKHRQNGGELASSSNSSQGEEE
jgi:hypothetical protein